LCCLSTSNTKSRRIFRYRLSPETSGYILVRGEAPVLVNDNMTLTRAI